MTPEHRKTFEAWVKSEGAKLYATFTEQERVVMRFGMFPAEKTLAAERELIRQVQEQRGEESACYEQREITRLLAVGCMDAANAGPDKLVV